MTGLTGWVTVPSGQCHTFWGMPSGLPSWMRDLARRDLAARRLRSLGLVCLALVDMAFTVTAFDMRQALADGTSTMPARSMGNLAGLLSLVAVGLSVAVIWRRRLPVALTISGALAAVLVLGPTVALIGLTSVIMWRPRSDLWRLGPLVFVATALATWRDVHMEPRSMSFWGSLLSPGVEPIAWYVPIVLTILVFGAFVGIGVWMRTRADLQTAQVVVAEERSAVSSLTDQLSRQAERERLAREIHDGLGHNLSILSVHAGALQAMADTSAGATPGGPATLQMRESAQVVRETAARSVAELHSLLDLLRNAGDPDVAAPTTTLRHVRELIDDSVSAGMPLVATVFVEDGETLDPHIARAAYRIVQELLTNARKHAPSVSVRLSVTGGAEEGHLVIATANHLSPPVGSQSDSGVTVERRAGMGLIGIRERVERYGGDMESGVGDDAAFRVSIRLPWRAPATESTKGAPWTT
ncbi:signal transduction histidine kinase [Humibacillus xanthopallidus]|uniref:histidine kinase n=2 Tax=Humibacillus xanthopallidus TaxID=412689 RepID=A0A543PNM5_9MICO|nr:signal transduction histidine kinase [Humibacillus xanthopallidus]